MRRVLLTVEDAVVEIFDEMPDLLLKQVKAFQPLLEASTASDFPLRLNSDAEIKPANALMRWLRRDTPLGELISNMIEFRALARCADKFAVLQLLDELAVFSLLPCVPSNTHFFSSQTLS